MQVLLPWFVLVFMLQPSPNAVAPLPASPPRDGARIELPDLPTSMQAAMDPNQGTRLQVSQTLKDLDLSLSDLYRRPQLSMQLGSTLKLPPERAEEARFLSKILVDSKYEQCENEIFNAWSEWQKALRETALREFSHQPLSTKAKGLEQEDPSTTSDRIQQDPREKSMGQHLSNNTSNNTQPKEVPPQRSFQTEPFASRLSPKPIKQPSEEGVDADQALIKLLSIKQFHLPSGRVLEVLVPELASTLRNESAWKERYSTLLSMSRRVATQQIPHLARDWKALKDHLGEVETRLATYEVNAPKDDIPELLALRLQAKAALLERFRCNAWIAGMVQSYLAFQPIVEVPKTIKTAPPPVQAMTPATQSGSAPSSQVETAGPTALVEQFTSTSGVQEPRPWAGIDAFMKLHVYAKSDEDLKSQLKTLYEESPRFRKVIEALWAEQPKVVFILHRLAKSDPSRRTEREEVRCFGSLVVQPVGIGFAVTLLTQTELASRGLDLSEPWLAQLMYAFLEVSRTGSVIESGRRLMLDAEVQRRMWNFQLNLRGELKATHPDKYKAMPYDGEPLFQTKLL